MARELRIRMWRMSKAAPYGMHLWFDPDTEYVRVFEEPRAKRGVPAVPDVDDVISSDESDQLTLLVSPDELPF